MNERIDDPVGTGVALFVGAALGIVVAAPMLPRTVPFADVTLGPIGATIVAGVVALVVVPVSLFFVSVLLTARP